MELIKYKSIIENDFEEYEKADNLINHETTKYSPYKDIFTILFAPYWVEHIENDTYYYYDCGFYESGVVMTTIDRYQVVKGSSLEGLINHLAEFEHPQIIKPNSENSLLIRQHEIAEGYETTHWSFAVEHDTDYVVFNLSHFPLRPEEIPENLYEKYMQGITKFIHDVDYMLVNTQINSHSIRS